MSNTKRLTTLGASAVAAFVVAASGSAWGANQAKPAWAITPIGVPTVLPASAGRHGRFDVVVENVGGQNSEGGVVVRDALPTGLIATNVPNEECNGLGTHEVECTLPEPVGSIGYAFLDIEFEEPSALPARATLHNVAHVSGGGAAEVAAESTIRTGEGAEIPGPAGISSFSMKATGPEGEAATQAGGHPTTLTTAATFNSMYVEGVATSAKPIEGTKDLVFYLPLGMLGNPTVADQCPTGIVEAKPGLTGCPPGSQIGTVLPVILSTGFAIEHGVYNLAPEHGYAAEFAFASNGFTFVTYANVVRHDGAYMVRASIPGVPVGSAVIGFVASFFGDIQEHFIVKGLFSEAEQKFDRGPFLTSPADCTEALGARQAELAIDTWEHPDARLPVTETSTVFPVLTGCESLSVSAALAVKPETAQADTPSGYEVGLEIPQGPNNASSLSTPPVKDTTVTFPVGTTISPSSANGLEACAETGPHGFNREGPESEAIAEDGLSRPVAGKCPPASQIATVKATTPLLREELTGRIFLATPECGAGEQGCTIQDAEDGKLFGLYLEVEGPNSGVVVKLKGHATVKQGTGQVAASFEEIPQFPFSKLVVTTKAAARAPFENAQSCGAATSTAVVTPWSSETRKAEATSTFAINWSGEGRPCPSSAPFGPTFTAGTTAPLAASTSPFTLTLKREDREQDIATLATMLPEGLLAYLSRVPRCPEPQASQNSLTACPSASQIGTTTVAVGPGSDPYYVTGKVFLTGPYGGAPFGLSVVVPAVAGPFNLGDVHVRVKLSVDPHTAQAIATSDPLPQEIDGVPARLRVLNVTLTNHEFVLNPTNCETKGITAAVTSTIGGSAQIVSPFAAMGCRNLPFNPTFSASTDAKATKANGTGVRVKIAYPSSREANVAKVVVGFPKQLPVRLETLQKACPAATFEANPAACPAASNVGTATAHTPILSQPLTGPVYLVSHGNAKFPDAVFVLQGEGITIDVDGQSFVSKDGALKVTFASVPDAPFSTFETVLPRGPFSQFTSVKTSGKAQGSQCGENLIAPVSMVAHNGAQLSKNVRLQITGCKPSVSIQKAKGTAHGLAVTVKSTVQGRLTIGGAGLRTLTKRNLAAGTHSFTVALTAAGRAGARAHRKTQLRVGLAAGKQRVSAHKKITI
jgi:hypothetical protein